MFASDEVSKLINENEIISHKCASAARDLREINTSVDKVEIYLLLLTMLLLPCYSIISYHIAQKGAIILSLDNIHLQTV